MTGMQNGTEWSLGTDSHGNDEAEHEPVPVGGEGVPPKSVALSALPVVQVPQASEGHSWLKDYLCP